MSRYLTARWWLAWRWKVPFHGLGVPPGRYATDGKRVWRLDGRATRGTNPSAEPARATGDWGSARHESRQRRLLSGWAAWARGKLRLRCVRARAHAGSHDERASRRTQAYGLDLP